MVYRWEVYFRNFQKEVPQCIQKQLGLNMVREKYTSNASFTELFWRLYRPARYCSIDNYGGLKSSYLYRRVGKGYAVSAARKLESDNAVQTTNDDTGQQVLYAIFGIIIAADFEDIWAGVKELKRVADDEAGSVTCEGSDIRILMFKSNACRVGLLHICDENRSFNPVGQVATHSNTVTSDGNYRVLKRADGSPPHMG